MRKKIYIVYEESHGNVSYWTTEKKAQEEVKKIIEGRWSKDEIQQQCKEEDVPMERYWKAFDWEVYYAEVTLNKSWV